MKKHIKKRNFANDLLSLLQKISMEDFYECNKSINFNSNKKLLTQLLLVFLNVLNHKLEIVVIKQIIIRIMILEIVT